MSNISSTGRRLLLAYLVVLGSLSSAPSALGFLVGSHQCHRLALPGCSQATKSVSSSGVFADNNDDTKFTSNDGQNQNNNWKKLRSITTLSTPWMTLQGERLLDNQDQELDYWRVEKEDSAVIVTIVGDEFVLPQPVFRPGLGKCTLDFPGGRVPSGTILTNTDETNSGRKSGKSHQQSIVDVATKIVQRELGLPRASLITSIHQVNRNGWPINSSFSNQLLFGIVAHLDISANEELHNTDTLRYSTSTEGVEALLADLNCLQCRMVLSEWLRLKGQKR